MKAASKLHYGLALGLLLGLGACSDMMGHHAPSAAESTPPSVGPGMVKQVQSKLHDDGFYKEGAIDGVWGTETQTAVRNFQQANHLTANGELDMPTLHALDLSGGASGNGNGAQDMAPNQHEGNNGANNTMRNASTPNEMAPTDMTPNNTGSPNNMPPNNTGSPNNMPPNNMPANNTGAPNNH